MTSPSALVYSSLPGTRPSQAALQEHIRSLRRAHVRNIAVVQPIREVGNSLRGVQLVVQPSAWSDPFDALVIGLFSLSSDALIVLPVENDLVSDATLTWLVREAADPREDFAVAPTCKQRRGYPVILFRRGIEAVVQEAANPNGLRYLDAMLARWGTGVRFVPVGDESVTYGKTAQA